MACMDGDRLDTLDRVIGSRIAIGINRNATNLTVSASNDAGSEFT